MSESLLNSIKTRMPELSKSHKKIAEYIVEHYDGAAFMTAMKIAEKVGVSESTVVRFACEMGYKGYPEFQKSLQDLVRKKLTDVQRIDLLDETDCEELICKTVKNDVASIEETYDNLDKEAFEKSVDAICSAEKIYFLGARSASIISGFLHYYLKLLFDNVILVDVSSDSEIYEFLFRITPKDVCIITSFPRYSKNIVNAAKFAHDRDSKIISITDSEDSPLAPFTDFLLIAKSAMASVVDSLTAAMSLSNCLVSAIILKKKEEARARFETLESFWEKYAIYENPEGREI